MEKILRIEKDLLPPEKVPSAPFKFPRAWTRKTIAKKDYFFKLPRPCMTELRRVAKSLTADPLPVLVLKPEMFDLAHCKSFMKGVKRTLEKGVGFAIIDRLPLDDFGLETVTAMHWLLGALMGRPVAQAWDGRMLYEVRDYGKAIGVGTRGSVTNAELRFHTDCSSNVAPPEKVGLLCARPAKEGGLSQLTNWYTVYNRLLETRPDLCARGFKPILYDRQLEHAPGEPKLLSRPPFAYDGSIAVRYSERLNYQGYKLAGRKMDKKADEMLKAVAEILEDPDIRIDLDFQPGQIQWINNDAIGHRRTGYKDDPKHPEKQRLLVRMWLREWGRISYMG
jgi:hypothetical protein